MRVIKPYYQEENITIYNGDCLEVMKELPDCYVDMVLTSPPYNLGEYHHTGSNKHKPYEDDMPEPSYKIWQTKILELLFQITKKKGSLLYNHKNRIKSGISITPYQWIFQSKWVIKQELVWFNRSQNFDKCRFYPMTERIYWLVKDKETQLFNTINHHDFFEWQAEGTDGEFKRAFPLKMAKDLISCFPEANTILDPFLGSGTTARACKDLNRKCIGIEISKKYCDIAVKRLGQEVFNFAGVNQ